uniref:Anaphase-promoting complex subunit 4 WD40 domain-containing protein n=2 Tax=Leptocylindrus danicus TaxID=163516 RepID=A0A7S2PGX9_9STRA
MNQTLEGHTSDVRCVIWNDRHNKLATGDENGLIIVWTLHKKVWYEEMINNRNKSSVQDIQWSHDGARICIIHKDSVVTVGSIEGSRLWTMELKGRPRHVQWSPDDENMLFLLSGPEESLLVYDKNGNWVKSHPISSFLQEVDSSSKECVSSINWYSGANEEDGLSLANIAIVSSSGRLYLCHNLNERKVIVIETNLVEAKCQWNNERATLAVSGFDNGVGKIKFYDQEGKERFNLRIEKDAFISSLAWEGSGVRIAISVGSCIYFANVRVDYAWARCGKDIVVYAHQRAQDKLTMHTTFWNIRSDERHCVRSPHLKAVISSEERVVMVRRDCKNRNACILQLCDCIGGTINLKAVGIYPESYCMDSNFVIVTDGRVIFVWVYSSQEDYRGSDELIFDIDEILNIKSVATTRSGSNQIPVALAVASSNSKLYVARVNGTLLCFSLPLLVLERTFTFDPLIRPTVLKLNCSSTKLSMISLNGGLSVFDLAKNSSKTRSSTTSTLSPLVQRKDTWDMIWDDDNPEAIAYIEKAKVGSCILSNDGNSLEFQETCSGYLLRSCSTHISAIMLDDIFSASFMKICTLIQRFDSKTLLLLSERIEEEGLVKAISFAEKHNQDYIWRALARAAIDQRRLDIAEKMFFRLQDYVGIRFIKRAQQQIDEIRQDAEIAFFLQDFNSAESIFRFDLALNLRLSLNDVHGVLRIVRQSEYNDDDISLYSAWDRVGDIYFDRFDWPAALTYYSKASSFEKMAECCCLLEDFDGLKAIRQNIVDQSPLSNHIDGIFQSFGMDSRDKRMTETYSTNTDSLMSEFDNDVRSLLSDSALMAAASPILRQKVSVMKAFKVQQEKIIRGVNAWRDSAALHYFILAHRQLYNGNLQFCMRTAIKCSEYGDVNVFDERATWQLIALSSFHLQYHEVLRRALIKLETLSSWHNEEVTVLGQYRDLNLHIFGLTKEEKPTSATLESVYENFLEHGHTYNACTLTGQAIFDDSPFLSCNCCNHNMLKKEGRKKVMSCALCRSNIILSLD